MEKKRIQWHPAFYAAMQIELEGDAPYLQFEEERMLTRKPLQMDMLIKKKSGYQCQKKIGWLFREYNILEYKNPKGTFGVNQFFKVIAYAANFQSNTGREREIEPKCITITVVCGNYPWKLVSFLKREYGISIRKEFSGIYYIQGALFPMQIVVNKELDEEEYKWLSRLHSGLKRERDIEVLSEVYLEKSNDPRYETVMDVIMRANEEVCEEAKSMCNALRELFADELAEGRERGRAEGRAEGTVSNLLLLMKNLQLTAEQAMNVLEIPTEERDLYMQRL